jgi:hypothetical protein
MANSQDKDILSSPYFSVMLHLGETRWDKWTILLFSQSKCLSCRGSNRETRCLGFDPHARFQVPKTSPERSSNFHSKFDWNRCNVAKMYEEQIDEHSSLYTQMRDYAGQCLLSQAYLMYTIFQIWTPFLKHCVYEIYTRKWTVFNIIFTYTACLGNYSQYQY